MASLKSVAFKAGSLTKRSASKVGSVTKSASVAVVNFDVHTPQVIKSAVRKPVVKTRALRARRVEASKATVQP